MPSDFTPAARYLSNEYRDLNGTSIETLENPPTALEFSRITHISRPVVIKGFDFAALRLWNRDYLVEKMGDRKVTVAVTPNGRADALNRGPDGRMYFVEPAVELLTMKELMNKLHQGNAQPSEVHYLQSQDGNLFSAKDFENPSGAAANRTEFLPLTGDVPKEIPWCSEALGQHPDAVNIWIGNENSVTSIHNDPYENIYTVVRGEKHFFLLPPTDAWCLQERYYPHATYSRDAHSGKIELRPSDESTPNVRWSSVIDPEVPDVLPPEIRPICVTLLPGETLYLPIGWWHYVRQSSFTVALNWWYDAELRGMSWVLLNFLRNPIPVLLRMEGDLSAE